jgi:hypothetical protein
MENQTSAQGSKPDQRGFASVPAEKSISKMGPAQKSELVRWLLSAMMLAQMFEMRTSARTIYDAVVILADDIDEVQLCLAFSSALNGDPRFARALRQKGFSGAVDEDRKDLTLSFVLGLGGDASWRSVPERLLETSTDEKILHTARIMLGR